MRKKFLLPLPLLPIALLYLFLQFSSPILRRDEIPLSPLSSSSFVYYEEDDNRPLPLCDMRNSSSYGDGMWVEMGYPITTEDYCAGHILDWQYGMYGECAGKVPSWRWRPRSCRLHPFSPLGFVDHLKRGRILIIGDSTQGQMANSLLCMLSGLPHETHGGNIITFPSYGSFRWLWSQYLVENRMVFDDPEFTGLLFEEAISLGTRMIVLNSGPWWSPRKCLAARGVLCDPESVEEAFRKGMRYAFSRLRQIFDGVIVYRLSTANREECLQRTGVTPEKRRLHSYDRVEERNAFMKELVKEYPPSFIIDPYPLSLGFPGHTGDINSPDEKSTEKTAECLHWCSPGLYGFPNTWNMLLYNILEQEE